MSPRRRSFAVQRHVDVRSLAWRSQAARCAAGGAAGFCPAHSMSGAVAAPPYSPRQTNGQPAPTDLARILKAVADTSPQDSRRTAGCRRTRQTKTGAVNLAGRSVSAWRRLPGRRPMAALGAQTAQLARRDAGRPAARTNGGGKKRNGESTELCGGGEVGCPQGVERFSNSLGRNDRTWEAHSHGRQRSMSRRRVGAQLECSEASVLLFVGSGMGSPAH